MKMKWIEQVKSTVRLEGDQFAVKIGRADALQGEYATPAPVWRAAVAEHAPKLGQISSNVTFADAEAPAVTWTSIRLETDGRVVATFEADEDLATVLAKGCDVVATVHGERAATVLPEFIATETGIRPRAPDEAIVAKLFVSELHISGIDLSVSPVKATDGADPLEAVESYAAAMSKPDAEVAKIAEWSKQSAGEIPAAIDAYVAASR